MIASRNDLVFTIFTIDTCQKNSRIYRRIKGNCVSKVARFQMLQHFDKTLQVPYLTCLFTITIYTCYISSWTLIST